MLMVFSTSNSHERLFKLCSITDFFYFIISYYRKDLTVEEAIELGKRAIVHATHRDAYSGGINNGTFLFIPTLSSIQLIHPSILVYHVGPNGWTKVWSGDTTNMYYEYYPLKTK